MIYASVGRAFPALVKNAPTGLVGAITVDVYDPSDDSVILAATTAGIVESQTGTYATTLTVSQAGAFNVRWAWSGGTFEEPLLVTVPPVVGAPSAMRPTMDEVGSLMRARTRVRGGTELGTFTDDGDPRGATRPTATEAEDQIDTAISDVLLAAGTPTDALLGFARNAVKYRAVQLIELAYWPEQNDTDQSVAAQFERMYLAAVAVLVERVQGDTPGKTYGFGSVPIRGLDGLPGTYTVSATLTSASVVVTLDDTSAYRHGFPVTGPGVPSGAFVQSVDSATQLSLSVPATVTGLSVLTLTAA